MDRDEIAVKVCGIIIAIVILGLVGMVLLG